MAEWPYDQPHISWERYAVRTPEGMLKGMDRENGIEVAEATGGTLLRSTAVYVTAGPSKGAMRINDWAEVRWTRS